MACDHKFKDELYLKLLDYAPETLIVGTFNPQWPTGNTARWFYGRTYDDYGFQSNNFWEVLPRLYGEPSLIDGEPVEWKDFCRRHLIAITDLIACIEDACETNPDHIKWLGSYSDEQIAKNFKEFDFTKIDQILLTYPTITHLYLTRGAQGLWKRLWRPIQQGRDVQTLLTPSDWARIQHRIFNKRNPRQKIERLPDFIKMRWQAEWHF
jgi:hypothetical protein